MNAYSRVIETRTSGTDRQEAWRRFGREQARKLRIRLIREGTIIPSYRTPPQLMVKVGGKWVPEIKYV